MTPLPDIEKKLQSLAPSAAGFDQSGVKAKLLQSIATTSLKSPVAPVRSPYGQYLKFSAIGLASFLFLFTGSAYASLSAIPGEPLYAMKVLVTEEIIALTKTSPQEKVTYAFEQLELRTNELATVVAKGEEVSPEIIALVSAEIADEVAILQSGTEDNPLVDAQETHITQLAKAKRLVEKQSSAVAHIAIPDDVPTLVESIATIESAIEAEVSTYVETVPTTTVASFVSEQVAIVDDWLLATSTPEHLKHEGEEILADMYTSLTAEDLIEAVQKSLDLVEVREDIDMIVE